MLPVLTITLTPRNTEQAHQIVTLLGPILATERDDAPETMAPPVPTVAAQKGRVLAKVDKPNPDVTDKSVMVETQRIDSPTIETVRARLAAISQAGKTDQVKELLQRFGADRLTALDSKHFAQLMAAAENL